MAESLRRMDDAQLVDALRALGPTIDWPGADLATERLPDPAATARARIESEAARAGRRWWAGSGRSWPGSWSAARRALVLALIALLALAAIAGAGGIQVPGLRILFGPATSPTPSIDASGPPSATAAAPSPVVPSSPTPEPTPPRPGSVLGLGQPTTLDALDAAAGFHVRWPTSPTIGNGPDAAWIAPDLGNQVALVWRPRTALGDALAPGVGLVLTEFDGRVDDAFFTKMLDGGTSVAPVTVAGHAGWWISGAPHEFFYTTSTGSVVSESRRWVGDVLVWSVGDITYRLETALPRDVAISLAASMP